LSDTATDVLYNNLGLVWKSKGDYQKALKYFYKSLEIDTVIFGSMCPEVAVRFNNLGCAWSSKVDYAKAVEYCQRALNINVVVVETRIL